METYHVQIIHLTTGIVSCITIWADEGETTDNIILRVAVDGQEFTASHTHYFVAFQSLRDQLLDLGYGMKCNGARTNAVASPMMANVAKVYLVNMGEHARMKDVNQTFDFADISEFPDTRQQEEFFKAWGKSLTSAK